MDSGENSFTITETDMSTLAISSIATMDVMKFEPEPPYFGSTSIPIQLQKKIQVPLQNIMKSLIKQRNDETSLAMRS